jgi:hypothetical protein
MFLFPPPTIVAAQAVLSQKNDNENFPTITATQAVILDLPNRSLTSR